MTDKRQLATLKFAKEVADKADAYGGGPTTQSLLNYLKKFGDNMVEQERENIRKAFEAGVGYGLNAMSHPFMPSDLYIQQNYEGD
jgi:hypothetical protein